MPCPSLARASSLAWAGPSSPSARARQPVFFFTGHFLSLTWRLGLHVQAFCQPGKSKNKCAHPGNWMHVSNTTESQNSRGGFKLRQQLRTILSGGTEGQSPQSYASIPVAIYDVRTLQVFPAKPPMTKTGLSKGLRLSTPRRFFLVRRFTNCWHN